MITKSVYKFGHSFHLFHDSFFSGEFSWFAIFFPVLFLISFFSSIFDYVMSCFSLEEVNLPDQRFAGGVCRGSAMRYFRRAGLLPGAW